MPNVFDSFFRRAWLALPLVLCCQGNEAARLLNKSIQAHGGGAALAQMMNFRVVSDVQFQEHSRFTRIVDYRAKDSWSMTILDADVSILRFGVDGERCWRKTSHFVWDCSPEERAENEWTSAVLDARFLHRLKSRDIAVGPSVTFEGLLAPTLQLGSMLLVIHPGTHLLVQIRYADRGESYDETFSEFQSVAGALIATRRVLRIDGVVDVDETWREIAPGKAATARIQPPAASVPGDVVDDFTPSRAIAWMDISRPTEGSQGAEEQLLEFIKSIGRKKSSSEGILLTLEEGTSAEPERWRIGMALAADTPVEPSPHGLFHVDVMPRSRIFGIFHQGGLETLKEAHRTLLRELDARRIVPAANARPMIVFREGVRSGASNELYLLQSAVEPGDAP